MEIVGVEGQHDTVEGVTVAHDFFGVFRVDVNVGGACQLFQSGIGSELAFYLQGVDTVIACAHHVHQVAFDDRGGDVSEFPNGQTQLSEHILHHKAGTVGIPVGIQLVIQLGFVSVQEHFVLGVAGVDALLTQQLGDTLCLGLLCLVNACGHTVVIHSGFVGANRQNEGDVSFLAPCIDGGEYLHLVGNDFVGVVGAGVVGDVAVIKQPAVVTDNDIGVVGVQRGEHDLGVQVHHCFTETDAVINGRGNGFHESVDAAVPIGLGKGAVLRNGDLVGFQVDADCGDGNH